jgi:hypothetical protein
MMRVQNGQCGLCVHFGESHGENSQLEHIRTTSLASEMYVDRCGHPKLVTIHLRVTAIAGCDGFEAVKPFTGNRKAPEAPQHP